MGCENETESIYVKLKAYWGQENEMQQEKDRGQKVKGLEALETMKNHQLCLKGWEVTPGCRKDRQQQRINLRIHFRQPQILALSSKFQMWGKKKKRDKNYTIQGTIKYFPKSHHIPLPAAEQSPVNLCSQSGAIQRAWQEVLCKPPQVGDAF